MKVQIAHKILSFAALALMALAPVQGIARAERIGAGTGTTSGNTINAGSNNIPANRINATGNATSTSNGNHIAAQTYNTIWNNHINASGTNIGNRVNAGNGTNSNGNRVTGNGNGCSLLPGGYCYDASNNRLTAGQYIYGGSHINASSNSVPTNRINATGNTNSGNHINASGNSSTGSHINATGNNGYGCSEVPGGYCYTPGENRIPATGNAANNTDNRITATTNAGGSSNGNRLNASGTSTTPSGNGNRIDASYNGYGCSHVPGGYCYQPGNDNRIDATGNNTTGDNRINASGSSTPTDGNRINANSNNNSGNRIDASGSNNPPQVPNPDTNACNNLPYPEDIDGHWAEIYVRRLYDLCIVEGYADGKFRPNQAITRAEMLKMGLLGGGIAPNPGCYDNDCGSPFYDLDEWQGPWVRSAYDHNIVEGYAYNRFAPNQHITRAEAVKVVLSTYNIAPLNVSESFFKDVNGWETGWVEKARVIGLVQGIGNGNFDPHRPITRAEAAKIIVKMIEYYDTKI